MAENIEKVDEIKIASDDSYLDRIDAELIYQDTSSLTLREKLLSKERIFSFFLMVSFFGMVSPIILLDNFSYVLFISMSSGLTIIYLMIFDEEHSDTPIHPRYYIISDNSVLEIPKNQYYPENSIKFNHISDINFTGSNIEFSARSRENIEFSLPNQLEIVKIQNELYDLYEEY